MPNSLPELPEQPDMALDQAQRRKVLEGIAEKLSEYVFPAAAETIQHDIHQRLNAGGYTDIVSAAQLAQTLTAQIQELSQDRNLRVFFSAEPLPQLDAKSDPTPEELTLQQHRSSLRNFDFNRVERLRGNVGYLELYGLEAPAFAGETAIAAMNFLAHTSALIIDLRHNSGGSPGMVTLLCSYLFPAHPPIHLNDLYWRTDDRTQQWWTSPFVPGKRYLDKPVYVLISQTTFSAAEEFAYNLKHLKRAALVGETTRGGANPGAGYRINDHFWIFIPTGRAINPITGGNWEGVGVIPDVKVPAELALKTAHLMALKTLIENNTEAGLGRELEESLQAVEVELADLRKELISKLGGRQ